MYIYIYRQRKIYIYIYMHTCFEGGVAGVSSTKHAAFCLVLCDAKLLVWLVLHQIPNTITPAAQ